MRTISSITTLLVSAGLLSGCVTTEDSYERTGNPHYIHETEQELKTDEDWERWHRQQKHNNNALIIIP